MLCFLSYRINAMLGESRSDAPSNIELMKTKTIIINVMERLFDELVKELALDRFVIVSGSVREKDGKAVRFRKAHLRRRRRWCLSYRSRPVLFTSGLAKERYFRLRIPLCGLYCWSYIPALQSLWLWTLRLPQISPLAPLGRNDSCGQSALSLVAIAYTISTLYLCKQKRKPTYEVQGLMTLNQTEHLFVCRMDALYFLFAQPFVFSKECIKFAPLGYGTARN